MKKLREENLKLQDRIKSLRKQYRELRHSRDYYLTNKLSLSLTKIVVLFIAGVAVGMKLQ